MKENHIAYKISREAAGVVCSQIELEKDSMLDLLREIQQSQHKGIYWVFKQLNGRPQEALCIIDCAHGRVYYHHSGVVDKIDDAIHNLDRDK